MEELKLRKERLLKLKEKIKSAKPKIDNLINYGLKLKKFFDDNKIEISIKHPFSMVFVLNYNYSKVIFYYQKILNSFCVSEDFFEELLDKKEIGVCDTWNIYEKWCLVKIIQSLIASGYIPENDWKQTLINGTQLRRQNGLKNNDIIFYFSSLFPDYPKIVLRYDSFFENSLGKIKRPDFILELKFKEKLSLDTGLFNNGQEIVSEKKMILDAKFKDWTENELQETLNELYSHDAKDYSYNGVYPVFLIHPKGKIITNQLSPLSWGKDCDYGGLYDHKKGHIFLSPSIANLSSFINLRRLILMFIQPHLTDICPTCGSRMTVEEKMTKSHFLKYKYDCPRCHKKVYENHCKSCRGTRLFKNGPIWTYHLTRAESVFNIICPRPFCHDYFDVKKNNNIDEEYGDVVYDLKYKQQKFSSNPIKDEETQSRGVLKPRQSKTSFFTKKDEECGDVIGNYLARGQTRASSYQNKGKVTSVFDDYRKRTQSKAFFDPKKVDEPRVVTDDDLTQRQKGAFFNLMEDEKPIDLIDFFDGLKSLFSKLLK